VILADTSAWVEYIRDGDSEVISHFENAVVERELAITEPIAMEVLAGGRNPTHAARLQSMLASVALLRVEGLADWERAAEVYRTCRSSGSTLRSQIDCLIAAVAIREDIPVLHADRDFDTIAQHTPLRTVCPS